jgi:putative membrane protein
MNQALITGQGADLRDQLAAERTLLAWVRTGLALMGFGLVMARFGLSCSNLRSLRTLLSCTLTFFVVVWDCVISAGVLVNILSAWQHARLVSNSVAAT